MTPKKKEEKEPVEENSQEPVESDPQEDIKLIEGKEPFKLEFFSKDEMLAKVTALETQVEDLKKSNEENSSWKTKYMRLQAEFENAEKRWIRNRQNLRIEYTASAIKSFLPLFDSFKKALENSDENHDIIKGFYDQFMNILKSHKAIPIDVKINDIFDYTYHEALSSIEKDDVPNNSIIEIIQDGWKLDKNIIRYAKVIVSREPKPPEPEKEKESEIEEVPEKESEPDTENQEQSKKKEKSKNTEDSKQNDYIS
ncbi:MAG: nucleotide exchange factor GrpE [Candidatus Lokiarchaeota archaeon]|nr:nucleotide exchange factor GrpE [Candidatus Lokiarchaeota archaeon]